MTAFQNRLAQFRFLQIINKGNVFFTTHVLCVYQSIMYYIMKTTHLELKDVRQMKSENSYFHVAFKSTQKLVLLNILALFKVFFKMSHALTIVIL